MAHVAGGSYCRPSRASISACSGCRLVLAIPAAADTSSLLLASSPAGCSNGASVLSASTTANAACGLLLLLCLLQHAVATVAGRQGATLGNRKSCILHAFYCLLVCLMKLKPLSADGESCNDKHYQGSVPGFASDIVSHEGWPCQSAGQHSLIGQTALVKEHCFKLPAWLCASSEELPKSSQCQVPAQRRISQLPDPASRCLQHQQEICAFCRLHSHAARLA